MLITLLINLSLGTQVAITYLWHLQQPIYWPAKSFNDQNTYQFAYESMTSQSKQGGHPENNLGDIFGKDDRRNVYQYTAANSINTVNSGTFGAQVTYPGDLIENVSSLADHNSLGYSSSWKDTYANMQSKKTSGGFPKMDMVGFPYHHALGPLVDPKAYDMEIQIQKIAQQNTWGNSNSKGFFPAEMAFSERLIPSLVKAGYEWVIVPNNHISRSCSNYTYSKYGDNNTPPNKADQINPSQNSWFEMQISRGCAPNNAVPFAFTPHYAKYVDPESGEESKIIVVPSAMAMSWQDGYECYSTNDIDKIASQGSSEHPMLIVLAHDGDNAFGGGYSYYMECVQNLMNQAMSKGYEPISVQQYLSQYPVDENDIVHVEDGAWVNADGDFGDPTFVNWNWPLFTKNNGNEFDVPNGWSDKQRHYAITTAAQNWVETAEQVSGGVNIEQVQAPNSQATDAELAWHFYLPSLTSGYLYYGTGTLDMCLKSALACNIAIDHAKNVVKSGFSDKTSPSVWTPYRLPYNPGGYQYGSLSKYQWVKQPTDFYIYTFAYDVSGISEANLYVRTDKDGVNSLNENYNEIYQSNTEYVSDWVKLSMTGRDFPKGNYYDWTNNCFANLTEVPEEISTEYYAYVTGYQNVLLDYYIEVQDTAGNVKKTDIYHVWVGSNDGDISYI